MKKFISFLASVFIVSLALQAQSPLNCNSSSCTTNSTIDQCAAGSQNVVTIFQNAVQKSGNPCGNGLCAGSVWRYSNVAVLSGSQIDAEIKVVNISNAVLDDVDDDNADDQAGNSMATFFGPRIGPDVNLNNSNRRGYVEFQLTFYQHFSNSSLNFITTQVVNGLNFVHYDIDGHTNGNNGWFRELGDVKLVSAGNPVINAASVTELSLDGSAGSGWTGFVGSVCERDGVSRCAQVSAAAKFSGSQSVVSFRMGYDYKAGSNEGNTVRQYGAKFGCFNFPSFAPLPVTISNLGVSYKAGTATLNWTSTYESNMKGYEIERSLDGAYFSTIGFTGAVNQFGLTKNYQYPDDVTSVTSKLIYYRLRMVDLDGKIKLSNVVSVRKDKLATNKLVIAPNPAVDNTQLKLDATAAGRGDVVVTDAAGKVLIRQTVNVLAGSNSILLADVNKLTNGIYNVKLVLNNDTYTEKLMIRK